METSVLFSIIIPSYNKGKFIEETLSSLEQQSYGSFETIVVDDASSDSSLDLIRGFTGRLKRLRIIGNKESKGACFCRNAGARLATGKYLIFLDADDLLDKNCLLNRLDEINRKPDNDMWIFGLTSFRKSIDNKISDWIPVEGKLLERFLSHQLPWVIHQAVWNRNFFERLKGFDETFPRLQDVELHTRALLNGARVVVSTQMPDCYYRVEDDRIEGNYEKFYSQWVKGTVCYYRKFHALLDVRLRKKLKVTVLYMIDALWYAAIKNKISGKCSRNLSEETLTLTVGQSGDLRTARLLKVYFQIKMRFGFNLPGLRRITFFFLTR